MALPVPGASEVLCDEKLSYADLIGYFSKSKTSIDQLITWNVSSYESDRVENTKAFEKKFK